MWHPMILKRNAQKKTKNERSSLKYPNAQKKRLLSCSFSHVRSRRLLPKEDVVKPYILADHDVDVVQLMIIANKDI